MMKINSEIVGTRDKAVMKSTTCEKVKSQKLELQVFYQEWLNWPQCWVEQNNSVVLSILNNKLVGWTD
jgi:hypothetical protein